MDHHAQLAPSSWVARFAPLVPPGEVLDLACGRGRHARLFAALGHPVLALDRDPDALAALTGTAAIATMPFDLEQQQNGDRPHFSSDQNGVCPHFAGAQFAWPFGAGRFAGIVVTNYLHRPLLPKIVEALRPDGILIYETFAAGNERFGKPSNPAFLLEEGELLGLGLRVIAYESGYLAAPKPAMVQRLCASGPAFAREKAVLAPECCQE